MENSKAHYRRLEGIYHGARCNASIGPTIRISEGTAEVRFETSPSMHHAGGAVHGCFYFKALDDAAFFAASSVVDDVFVATASFSLELLRPVVKGELRAVGRVKKRGRSLVFAESTLFDDKGRELAVGRGTFVHTAVPIGALYVPGAGEDGGESSTNG